MSWDLIEKSGFALGGWLFNETNLSFNDDKDPDTVSDVTYNSLGIEGTWTLLNKS